MFHNAFISRIICNLLVNNDGRCAKNFLFKRIILYFKRNAIEMDGDKSNLLHIPLTVDENNVEEGALKILEVIRPHWDKSRIKFKLLTDGITNKLVGCKPEDFPEEETVLIRMYGNKTDLLIDRKAETRNIILLNKAGLAPEPYATFQNGLSYKFIPGCTLNSDSARDPNIYKLVAKTMAQLHKVCPTNGQSPKPFVWDKLQRFLNLIPDVFSDPEKNTRYQQSGYLKSIIENEIKELKPILINSGSPVVFAHNDLLLGNVIYTEKSNTVTFIDYEYAAFNYQAFDIGNHFCEFVGLQSVDYSKYPDKELQIKWLTIYLTEYYGTKPTEVELDKLYVQVNKFSLLSHILWGLWAYIQAEHSNIDFDYLEYACIRFEEYFRRKSVFLSLKGKF